MTPCGRHYAALLTEEMTDTVEFRRPAEAEGNGGTEGDLVQIPKAFLEDLLARVGQRVGAPPKGQAGD